MLGLGLLLELDCSQVHSKTTFSISLLQNQVMNIKRGKITKDSKFKKDHFRAMFTQCGQSTPWSHLNHLDIEHRISGPTLYWWNLNLWVWCLEKWVLTSPEGILYTAKVQKHCSSTEVNKHFFKAVYGTYALCHNYTTLPL